jgi:hypothetical protein
MALLCLYGAAGLGGLWFVLAAATLRGRVARRLFYGLIFCALALFSLAIEGFQESGIVPWKSEAYVISFLLTCISGLVASMLLLSGVHRRPK